MNCEKCGGEMETALMIESDPGTMVAWHKDGTPDDCQNKVLVAVCKKRDELQTKYDRAIESLKKYSSPRASIISISDWEKKYDQPFKLGHDDYIPEDMPDSAIIGGKHARKTLKELGEI